MEFVTFDFSYYKRTMEGMYHSYYLKRIILMAVGLLITVVYTLFFPESILINLLLILLFGAGLAYFIYQRMQFNELYEGFLKTNEQEPKIEKIEEDEFTYNILLEDGEKLKINKTGVRNLPSNNKELTLMVGFTKSFFSKQPFHVVYYNMFDLTYEEKYRLSKNRVSRVPRFLRPFTWRNLKSSSTNLFRLIIGNLFTLYLLYRLARYVIDIIRTFM
ncbi:hypothetical protein [Enterococcus sp. BWR-S5]|uniref:hypothetical protein n=1 Tax=Enterococcus sp. BWR-S5 TaxID=2787714 RepID=UPI0019216A9F|nr:hypothetical protein [Enterococcus sp. BWR-S5]MBL1225668.1 hypothetical protein [Enterococcus sp. BWR-S5]